MRLRIRNRPVYPNSVSLGLLLISVWLLTSSSTPVAMAQVSLPYPILEEAINRDDWAKVLSFKTETGKQGIYIKLDRQFELLHYPRPDTTQRFLYAYWPEELFFNQVRYWVEITGIKTQDQEMRISFQSRSLGDTTRMCYVGHLRFKRTLDGWKLAERKIHPLD